MCFLFKKKKKSDPVPAPPAPKLEIPKIFVPPADTTVAPMPPAPPPVTPAPEPEIKNKFMYNEKNLFDKLRSSRLFKSFSQAQVDNIKNILRAFAEVKIFDIRFLAYALATTYHETAGTMRPIEEYGKGKGRDYGKKLKRSRVSYLLPDKIYFGRGYVQLTWFENYQLLGRLLGIDLLGKPELALDPFIAAKILVEGMTKGSSSFGDFTGKCLEMYFNDKKEDPIEARRIINGEDKKFLIADYYWIFKEALS